MDNQTAPATNNASKSVDGYATDQSQTGPCRSSRVPTPSKSGSHVNTPADSRQSLGNRPNVPRKRQRRGSGSSAGSTHVAPSSQVSVQNTSKRAPLNTQNRSPLRPHTVHKRTLFKLLSLKKTPKGNNHPPSSARPQSSITPTSDAWALPVCLCQDVSGSGSGQKTLPEHNPRYMPGWVGSGQMLEMAARTRTQLQGARVRVGFGSTRYPPHLS
ncbi:hypothetical protein PSTG_11530 [Puccinia striiformis f. sp. tritici PST-78]|uniref:Uncharacterized protein n=1 Tax=Puccinia striiformis f. sp. tritici PST-78 TaxID=1165861 RepID=A0A0L0V846_9BASI|nr:hypothetical protein PSTG_11530 [Puccinia striiformis f. sp. tritici PST-78]